MVALLASNRRSCLALGGIALATSFVLILWTYILSTTTHESTEDNSRGDILSQFASALATDTDGATAELVRLESLAREKCDNPYTHPGYLYYVNENDFRESKWVPFYSGMLDKFQSDRAAFPRLSESESYPEHETFPDGPPPDGVLDMTPYSWMRDLKDLSDLKKRATERKAPLTTEEKQLKVQLEDRLYWVRDRRILMLADSVDRYMAIYMCEELDGIFELGPAGFQTTATCVIKHLNVTFMHWHVSSTYTSVPPWWWMRSTKYVAIEERWQEYYLPTVKHTIGKNGRSPDLVMLQSGLWDQTMFALAHNQLLFQQGKTKKFSKTPNFMRSLNWEEMNFYMHRLAKIIDLIRSQFGSEVPIVFRSITHKANGSETMSIYDVDRAARFVCKELDVEYMEFGSLVSGHYDWYRDKVHLKDGPLSALWGNILMWYLFRTQGGNEFKGTIQRMPPNSTLSYEHSITDAWKECHDVFMRKSFI